MSTTAAGGRRPVRRALVSVYDKAGLAELATGLHAAGVEIVSTGGSAALVAGLGLPVTRVEELTGFPEALEGRVKTLHPAVHAGLLADTRKPEHLDRLAELGIAAFELVVANLYPFAATLASGADEQECIEQIDIGGPSMVRAAAKNHASVAVLTDPATYAEALEAVRSGGFTLQRRRQLAAAAFRHTGSYDVAVASWMTERFDQPEQTDDPEQPEQTDAAPAPPAWVGGAWERAAVLRYGENPHQQAALYRGVAGGTGTASGGLAGAEQLHGKEMSYNNYVDADAAWRAAHDHGDRPTVAIIKHANPCGIAVGVDIAEAHRLAHACDPVSAYGGVVAASAPVTAAMAQGLEGIFTEVVVAPDFEPEALELLRAKKNLRLLRAAPPVRGGLEVRAVSGGLLVQQADAIDAVVDGGGDDPQRWRLATGEPADEATLADLAFAWRAVRAVKSNAILLARGGASVGIGMGQVNRVDSCRLAVGRAGAERAAGSVASSDAFFPFADGLQILLDAGVRAVVAPGGSIRDDEVVAAAAAAGATLYLTGTRHFAH